LSAEEQRFGGHVVVDLVEKLERNLSKEVEIWV